MYKLRLVLSLTLALIILLGSSSPAFAQVPENPASIKIEPQITTVYVGDIFEVKIWIRDLDPVYKMENFRFFITWDPSQLSLNGQAINMLTGWGSNLVYSGTTEDGHGYFGLEYYSQGSGYDVSEDRYWETLSFHCLAPGSTPLNLPPSVDPDDGPVLDTYINPRNGEPYNLNLVKGAVNQIEIAPVGGISSPVSKLEILTPYIALVGLIAAVSTVYIIKKR
jgi:hypothetical protein